MVGRGLARAALLAGKPKQGIGVRLEFGGIAGVEADGLLECLHCLPGVSVVEQHGAILELKTGAARVELHGSAQLADGAGRLPRLVERDGSHLVQRALLRLGQRGDVDLP